MILNRTFQIELLTKMATEYPHRFDLQWLYPEYSEQYPMHLANIFYLQECGFVSDGCVLVSGGGTPEYRLGQGRITAKGLNFLLENV